MAKKRGNHEGSIYPWRDGFRAQVSIEGRRLSHVAKTQKECREWLKKTIAQIDEGLTYAGTRLTFAEFLKDWIASKKGSLRPGTQYQYELEIQRRITPYLGRIKLQDLRPHQIQRLYAKLQDKGVGASTIHKTHVVILSSLSHAVKTGLLTRNPARATIVPKAPHKEMVIFDEKQISQLFITLQGHRWAALYHLAIVTGMRQMEILGLKWTDLDWADKIIKVERQLDRDRSKGIQFSRPKTRTGRRMLKLSTTTVEILRSHYEHQFEIMQSAGNEWQDFGLIFTTNVGTPICHSNLRRDFRILCADAGLPRIRFHDLRHTSASLMINNGIHFSAVAKRLGHARPSITLDVYSHLDDGMQDKVVEIIDEVITPIAIPQLHTNCTQNSANSEQC